MRLGIRPALGLATVTAGMVCIWIGVPKLSKSQNSLQSSELVHGNSASEADSYNTIARNLDPRHSDVDVIPPASVDPGVKAIRRVDASQQEYAFISDPLALLKSLRLHEGPDLDRVKDEIIRAGPAGVAALRACLELGYATPFWSHRAIEVLALANSPESRQTLYAIAVGEFRTEPGTQLDRWAAQKLLNLEPSKAEALLVSGSSDVQALALKRLAGRPLIEDHQFERIASYLTSDSLLVRCLAAEVLARDPAGRYAEASARCLVAAIDDAASMPHADGFGRDLPAISATSRMLSSLSRIQISNDSLRSLASGEVDRSRYAIWLALAVRGDTSVRHRMHEIMADTEAESLHACAAVALGEIGDARDLPLLRRISASRPTVRSAAVPPSHLGRTGEPLPHAAVRAMARIEARLGTRTREFE